jgi:hypothetical protein
VIGNWEATNVAGGYTVIFQVRIYKNGAKIEGEIVNTNVGPPLQFQNFAIGSDRSFTFSVTAVNGAVIACTGVFDDEYKTMTGDSSITGGGQSVKGKWTGRKLI